MRLHVRPFGTATNRALASMTRCHVAILALVAAASVSGCRRSKDVVRTSHSETEVYAAVLATLADTLGVAGSPAELLAVRRQTVSDPMKAVAPRDWVSYVRDSVREGSCSGASADYVYQNPSLVTLTGPFALPAEYALVSSEELAALRSDSEGEVDWERFRRRYPGAQGIVSLSPVGFARDGRSALVYADLRAPWPDGRGWYFCLTERAGRWQVAEIVLAWLQ